MKVMIINGPNLNLLGKREEAIYGNISFEDYFKKIIFDFPEMHIEYYQSNIEGELINKLHELDLSYAAVLLNAGGYSHTSVSLTDAVAAIEIPVIEVHLSNIYNREGFRRKSLLSHNCKGIVCGFGIYSYKAALIALKDQL